MQPTIGSRPSRADKVREAKLTLDQHVKELAHQMEQGRSETLVQYLEFTAQFHTYSFRNIMLALSQRDDLTRIAGLRQWNKFGRHVRAGEKGIMILAPMAVRSKSEERVADPDADSAEPSTITLFKPVYVFDVAQTEGDELPSLTDTTGDVSGHLPALEQAVRQAGIDLQQEDIVSGSPSADGASFGGRIVLKKDLPLAERFRTLAHEFAHEKLHWTGDKENKTVRETEADAVAFVVCRHFGIDCDASDYLLLYNSEPKILLDRLETIRHTAGQIIEAVEGTQADPETAVAGNNLDAAVIGG